MSARIKSLGSLQYRTLAAAVAVCCGGAIALPAVAQQQTPTPDEEVIVTGSFLSRPADRPQPVTVLNAEELHLEQRHTLAEVFRNLPQVNGTSAIVNGGENFVSPTTTVNLRGLGPRATLVLMNGRRQTIDGNPGLDGVTAVDINNLAPSIMIERVEVLTDGASALYGSDAVAGVVNLITRNNFEGFELKAEMQSIAEIQSSDFTVGALYGARSGNTSVVAGFEWASGDKMNSEDRYSEQRIRGAALPSAFANPGSFRALPSGIEFADPLCGSDQIGGGLAAGFTVGNPAAAPGQTCQMSLGLGRAIVPQTEQLNGLAVATHDFGDSVSAQVEAGFARARYTYDFGYGLPILPPFPVMPGSNPGVAAAGLDTSVDYAVRYRIRSPAGDVPTDTRAEQDTFRVAGSLMGDFGDSNWNWNATFTFSQNESLNVGGDTIRDRFNAAIQGRGGPNCPATGVPGVGDCFWFNPFANRFLANPGEAHFNDPILAGWVFARSNTDGFAELETLDFVVTGELGEMAGGATGLAVGVQTRSQEFRLDFDPITEDGGYAFNTTPQQDYGGVRDTDALFAELVMYPTETLEIQLAARYEDYGSVDSTDPKIGLLWTPTDGLFIRATAGTSFRQPGETQSFGTASQGSTTQRVGGRVINARGLLQGNLNLQPEESENFTLGFTWDVSDTFTMDLNFWTIDFSNLIVTEDGQVILLNDMADGVLNDPRITLFAGSPTEVCEVTQGYVFDPVTAPVAPAGCVTGDDIALFTLSYINQDFQKTAGLDFNFDWQFSGGANEWGFGINGTYVTEYELTSEGQVFDGVGSYNGANFGFAMPELRTNLRFDWMRGNHMARAVLRHIAKLDEDVAANTLTEEKSFNTLDLLYEYTLPGGRSNLTFAMLNATDEEDPIRQGDLRTVTSFVYDLRGRMYRVGFNWGF